MALLPIRRQTAPRVPPGTLVYAVGDVHGEIALLAELLEAIADDAVGRGAVDVRLVLLGDLIDRGPAGAVLLRGFSAADYPGLVVLKGNHEAALLAACHGDEGVLPFWLEHGAAPTLVGLGVPPDVVEHGQPAAMLGALHHCVEPATVAWLQRLPTSCTIGDYFFTHAGVRPGRALAKQRDEDLLWIRSEFLESPRDHGKVVVHGHSIEPAAVRLRGNRIGLDTGAHEHGVLSAVGLQGDGQWLIQAHRHRRHAAGDTSFATVDALLAEVFAATPQVDEEIPSRGWVDRLLSRGGSVTAAAAIGGAMVAAAIWLATSLPQPSTPPSVAPIAHETAVADIPAPLPSASPPTDTARPPVQHRLGAAPPRRPSPEPAPSPVPTTDPYAGRVAQPLSGAALTAARAADADATRRLNEGQLAVAPPRD